MSGRIYNFSSGPAMMPQPVLERAAAEMLSFDGTGMSVMEMSHRSQTFGRVLDKAEAGLRTLLAVPDDVRILFIQGGGSLQFSMLPMNFLAEGATAEFVVTGHWGKRAAEEARKFGGVKIAFSSEADGFRGVPGEGTVEADSRSSYLHYVANETIEGVELPFALKSNVPVVCDMSSNILSRPLDWTEYSLVYAGAQKNIGPSGIAIVFIRDEMLSAVRPGLPSVLDYQNIAAHNSMVNTPNTWAIYMVGLVCDWVAAEGGVIEMERRAVARSSMVYEVLDASGGFYAGHAVRAARSRMNVTFRLANDELTERFCRQAEENGLSGLRGHRTVGGVRASIYNAFPLEGVEALCEFMSDFAAKHGG